MAEPARAAAAHPGKVTHRCPVCGTRHEISLARAEMGYGRQICCSPDCEGERRRRSRGHPARIVTANGN
jgi:hypothetical protein